MTATIRPLLKWVGGKRQLLPLLRRHYPARFGRYIEPFFGSGAVFFDLHHLGRLRGHEATLIDSNADLIGCYEAVRDSPDAVCEALEALADDFARRGSQAYYDVRDERFNPAREARRNRQGRIAYTPELAAMLIFLNRTGFNGLFRVNAGGRFNVPAGRYRRPRILDRERLMRVADALSAPSVTLTWGMFDTSGDLAARGDFLYIDPPYAPLTSTANFTSYTAPGFGSSDQERLQRLVVALARRGCHILLSNSTASEIVRLYDDNEQARRAGLRALRVPARRAVNSRASGRGPVEEYVITNV